MTMDHSRLVHHHSTRGDDGRRARDPPPHPHARPGGAAGGRLGGSPVPASASAAELGLRASAEHPLEPPELSEPTPATLQLPAGPAFTD
jgi:hypothetical protein